MSALGFIKKLTKRTPKQAPEQKLIFIAVMDAEERTLTHIHSLLRSADLHFTYEGEGFLNFASSAGTLSAPFVCCRQSEPPVGWFLLCRSPYHERAAEPGRSSERAGCVRVPIRAALSARHGAAALGR